MKNQKYIRFFFNTAGLQLLEVSSAKCVGIPDIWYSTYQHLFELDYHHSKFSLVQ